ncbi:MAG: excinuclease ABC subunit UvrA [Candidatus Zipacnadales bacterium]
MSTRTLTIRGAREHNLSNVNLTLPKNRLICFTGVSGSGKSSLAFDTIYAEGQRRYIESLSAYARQFLDQLPKPDVDVIEGLTPAISIEQKGAGRNPRSTVGTITEIYDYLRILYAAIGQPYCPQCNRPIGAQSREEIMGRILSLPTGARVHIMAPLAVKRKGEFRELFEDMRKLGFIRVRVDGELITLTEEVKLDRYRRHDVEVVTDRGTIGQSGFSTSSRARLAEAVDQALELGHGAVVVVWEHDGRTGELTLSSTRACPRCGIDFPPLTHASFSFNLPLGMCPACHGLGTQLAVSPDLLVPDKSKSLEEGAIPILPSLQNPWRRHFYEGIARHLGFTLQTPWRDLTKEQRHVLLYGAGQQQIEYYFKHPHYDWEYRHTGPWEGIIPQQQRRYREAKSAQMKRQFEAILSEVPCAECHGQRLRKESLAVKIGGRSIAELCAMSVGELHHFLATLRLTPEQQRIAQDPLKEIKARLGFLLDVGLHYLTLDRTAPTLAGGEAQRIRLASQIGSGLVGVLYVLDEPSIGLHHRDNARLLRALKNLRDMGNTVVVVEHDEATILAADHIIDFGPGAGMRGGQIIATGSPAQIAAHSQSLTGKYLRRELQIPVPQQRRRGNGTWLTVHGARQNNLKNIDVRIPLGAFTCITGVSGSGKSSLVEDIIHRALARQLNRARTEPGDHDKITGVEHLDKVIDIDQSPIGRTPRSNPATYVGLLTPIRSLFAQLPESRARGYKPGRFSFNVRGGRCEACGGPGAVQLEVDFLTHVGVVCVVCGGARFNQETLQIEFKGKNIADVLAMDVSEALEHFADIPPVRHILETLRDVGMEYVRLAQPAPTLSGGEAQRVKLAKELARKATGRTLYLLDEPTTGLHFADVQNLLAILHRLVDDGNTVIVVEHNMEVIKTADYLIDLGPEGGEEGGWIVAQGTPEEVAKVASSYTGRALKMFLATQKAHRRIHPRRNGHGARIPKSSAEIQEIHVRGAREHNLRNVNARIPRNRITVFSGVSGSGKSSLALDTIYAEGQRRYVESLSAYARQFVAQMPKPKVDQVTGLSPAISIEQKQRGGGLRSTVGTVTEVHDYLRALYSRIGLPYCPHCNEPIVAQTTSQIIERVAEAHAGHQVMLLAPVEPKQAEEYRDLLERIRRDGFRRVRLDGEIRNVEEDFHIDRRRKHRLEIVVDRLAVRPTSRTRLADSIEQALDRSGGLLTVAVEGGRETTYSQHASCPKCLRTFEPLDPKAFSFNHPRGWCPHCEGLGSERGTDERLAIPDRRKSIAEGAVSFWGPVDENTPLGRMIQALAQVAHVPLSTPWRELTDTQRAAILHGTGERWIEGEGFRFRYLGLFAAVERVTRRSNYYRDQLGRLMRDLPCRACGGGRLRPEPAAVRVHGKTLVELCELPLEQVLSFFEKLELTKREQEMAGEVVEEIRRRLRFLVDVGLQYVTLNRPSRTLSGGESQRIQLAGQIGSGLSGVLYVLDEPTIGLHPRDNARLLAALRGLRNLGNTVILVEHDRDTLLAADHLIDFGPGAGPHGGRIVASGTPEVLQNQKRSLTGRYLRGDLQIAVPQVRRPIPSPEEDRGWLTVVGARHNNLRDITVRFPLGCFICVTGPSGSGKSSLVHDILYNHLAHVLHRAHTVAEEHDAIIGVEQLDKVVNIDQAPLGYTPRSNPATYSGVFELIRQLFAQLPEAKMRGFGPRRFSFNARSGQCTACVGLGSRCIEMHFLPDIWVPCEVCEGRRYNPETLEVKYRGKSIADILQMSVEQALRFLEPHPSIKRRLQTLEDVGLGYLELGQPAPTLSGGEAQRVRLASELARPSTGRTIYLLDEPTTGLHAADVQRLLWVLERLVEAGNTVVVIEHNIEVIKCADWVIDLGPGGGNEGGELVVTGPPEVVAECPRSATAPFLRKALKTSERREDRAELLERTIDGRL